MSKQCGAEYIGRRVVVMETFELGYSTIWRGREHTINVGRVMGEGGSCGECWSLQPSSSDFAAPPSC
ncbi:hypothetical protein MPTK1_4g14490 [Marchantia polymorpha subsp. ruderalis]|uniref:Uncharacterized protein n=2 Tax=Marchantia polymorpha TaxID=3197 RepID=A0AAF6B9V5_MARPO|nr:hypothetical protein MARPO_0070s0032 [Marchantia polymorpha]BBN08789.1 hypothetical protein Mp_4g14490 [Marchantia polymorpha subsp. ruderalis]|eukprot:PTQ35563.1 hypothetical protein MARPO_0070s0032 [Marchantia polymorpha]